LGLSHAATGDEGSVSATERRRYVTSIAVVYQSGKGHTRILADAVLKGVQRVPEVSGNTFEIAGDDVHEIAFAIPY
jgi:hypothetical protein